MSIAASSSAQPAQRPAQRAPRSAQPMAAPSAAVPRAAARVVSAAPAAPVSAVVKPIANASMFAHLFDTDDADDEIHLQLSDLPRMSAGLEVEGFNHSLLSRVLGVFIRR